MTINHIYLMTPPNSFSAIHNFYISALAPIGYTELHQESPTFTGLGSSYPVLWLKALPDSSPEGMESVPTHIAFDAEGKAAVDEFYKLAIKAGGKDNGGPGLRYEGKDQVYAAFVIDPAGNNVEVAVAAPAK